MCMHMIYGVNVNRRRTRESNGICLLNYGIRFPMIYPSQWMAFKICPFSYRT